jgi:hypothetical protein
MRPTLLPLFELQSRVGEMNLMIGRSVAMQQLMIATAGSATDQNAASCIE